MRFAPNAFLPQSQDLLPNVSDVRIGGGFHDNVPSPVLNDLFSRYSLKGRAIVVMEAVSDSDVTNFNEKKAL